MLLTAVQTAKPALPKTGSTDCTTKSYLHIHADNRASSELPMHCKFTHRWLQANHWKAHAFYCYLPCYKTCTEVNLTFACLTYDL